MANREERPVTETEVNNDTVMPGTERLHFIGNEARHDSGSELTERLGSGLVVSETEDISVVQNIGVDVDSINLAESTNLVDSTHAKSVDGSINTSDEKDSKSIEDEHDDFFEAKEDVHQDSAKNVLPEPRNSEVYERLVEQRTDIPKIVDVISETESYSSTSEGSSEDIGFQESLPTVSSESRDSGTSHEPGYHDGSDQASNEHTTASATREALNGHIRGSNKTEDGGDTSDTDGEYESADEGEEIQLDAEQLKNLEESLTEEQKEEQRNFAQVLKEEGNELFRCGSYKSAIKVYSRALRTCPLKFAKDRAIMYSNRAVCKMKLTDNEAAIRDCSKALDLHPHYMKALVRRAELYEKTEKLDEALTDYQKILELDPSQHSARAACMRLPEQIKERNEKLKAEMIDKLKDLGNLILRPFGLSTNNFQLNQDPNSGGYSVNFVQNSGQ